MNPRGASLLAVFFLALAAMGVAFAQGDGNATAEDNATAPGETPAADDEIEPPSGEGTAGGEAVATYITTALDVECPPGAAGEPCWTLEDFPALPGQTIRLVADFTPSEVPHNIHVMEPISKVAPPAPVVGGVHTVEFQVPEDFDEPIKFICDVHPTTMVGFIHPPGAIGAAAGDGAPDHGIVSLGVHYLAYWVGVIAFAVLFIVYALTFFLFKHGESNATTDHMNRPGAPVGAEGENRLRAWVLVGVTVVLVAAGLVLTFMNMPGAE